MTPDVDFNLVLDMLQQFGPERLVPIAERWRLAFPQASDDDLAAWKARCDQIEEEAFELGRRLLDGSITEAEARESLHRTFPELDDARVRHTVWQGRYFAEK